MKKIITLALAAAFTLAAYVPASAVDVKMDGEFMYQFQTSSDGFTGDNASENGQRMRIGMTLSMGDNLSGYFQIEAEDEWGAANHKHGNTNLTVRQSYVDWTIPSTDVKVRMGRHAFDMPAYASASPIICDMVAEGVVLDTPFTDSFGLTSFWTRYSREANGDVSLKSYDIFGVVGNASFENLSITPWAIYASKGLGANDSDDQGNLEENAHGDLVLFGAGMEWKPFDPFTFAIDAAYGHTNYSDRQAAPVDPEHNDTLVTQDQEGWYVAAKASYALDFGEPAILAWYASGDKKGADMNSGQLPTIYGDFDGTTTFFDAACGLYGGHRTSIGGTWGIGLQLNGVSFIENLSHDFSVTYIAGTNSKYNGDYGYGYDYMTAEDSAVEFDVTSTYELYKNLTAALELAYIIEDYDTSHRTVESDFKNDWRVGLTFTYAF